MQVVQTQNDPQAETAVVEYIYRLVNKVVLVDAGVARHGCKDEVDQFLADTQLPVYATPMGKTVVSETYPRYGGGGVHPFSPECHLLTRSLGLLRGCQSSEDQIALRISRVDFVSRCPEE